MTPRADTPEPAPLEGDDPVKVRVALEQASKRAVDDPGDV